jgi:DNA helicase-2/ATP-dependent DNA helicase PcrA
MLYRAYQERKRRMGKIDFDDMLNMCYRLLMERPDILERIRALYPYIMVDEFQDTNRIQYEILKLLAHPRDNLFVVGDDDQSIYGFRGARPDIMLGFGKEFPGTEMITLGINYRCPKVITEHSAKMIGRNKKRYAKTLTSSDTHAGSLMLEFPKDVGNENDMILQRIRESFREGVPYGEMAVLYRTNMNPRRLVLKLREFNIPFAINDAIPDIFQHFAVQTVMDYILFAIGDCSRERFLRFMNKPVRYISRNMLSSPEVDMRDLLQAAGNKDYLRTNIRILNNQLHQISRLTPFAAIQYIRKGVGYDEYLEEYADVRNIDFGELTDILDELQSMARDFQDYGSFFDFVDDYRAMLKDQAKNKGQGKETGDQVHLMTMHSSKGLEFREVHIIECVEDIIPHKKQKTDAELEEERRMFYVAMTRAREKLYLYAPKTIGAKPGKPSRFLYEFTG